MLFLGLQGQSTEQQWSSAKQNAQIAVSHRSQSNSSGCRKPSLATLDPDHFLVAVTELCCWHLQRAVQKVMKRNLSDAPLQIVFALFDANQDGNLAATELVTVSNHLGILVFFKLTGLLRASAIEDAWQIIAFTRCVAPSEQWVTPLVSDDS